MNIHTHLYTHIHTHTLHIYLFSQSQQPTGSEARVRILTPLLSGCMTLGKYLTALGLSCLITEPLSLGNYFHCESES